MKRVRFLVKSTLNVFLFVGILTAQTGSPQPQITNSVGMELVLIHPGSMQVGVFTPSCPSPDPSSAMPTRQRDPRAAWTPADYKKCAELAKQDASNGFPVRIGSAYYIGKYEVTQDQWRKVMGTNPSTFKGTEIPDSGKHPVESVTWRNAVEFIGKLNALEHTDAYHLPSEFQWEYACRAGEPGQQSWSEIRETAVQGLGWGGGRNAQASKSSTTASIGSKKPNAWGLYDMLGNVWEWVADPYNGKIFPDPPGVAATGSEHVLKGGGFASDLKNAICATHGAGPGDVWDVGFRIEKDIK